MPPPCCTAWPGAADVILVVHYFMSVSLLFRDGNKVVGKKDMQNLNRQSALQ